MTFPNLLYGAAFWFVLTMLSSFIGDDDIVYNCMSMNRSPTGKETLARMRFVFPKLFASLYCGGLLAMLFTQNILRGVFSLNPSRFTDHWIDSGWLGSVWSLHWRNSKLDAPFSGPSAEADTGYAGVAIRY